MPPRGKMYLQLPLNWKAPLDPGAGFRASGGGGGRAQRAAAVQTFADKGVVFDADARLFPYVAMSGKYCQDSVLGDRRWCLHGRLPYVSSV
jgi:hypothetical protein